MRVRLLSFGPLKTALPPDGAWFELAGEGRVADLVRALVDDGTFSDAAMRTAAVAVNKEYAGPEHLLSDGDEVAMARLVGALDDEPIEVRGAALGALEDLFDFITASDVAGNVRFAEGIVIVHSA